MLQRAVPEETPVSGQNGDRKRLIRVTAGNLRNSHISIAGHHDFFPADCYGGAGRSKSVLGTPVSIELDGLGKTIETDIARDSKTGRPRREFRGRSWVREFFARHRVASGDTLELKRLSQRRYKLSVAGHSAAAAKPTFAEFFAGIGLVRMGLEAQGWRLLYANDMDAQKREMYDGHFGDASAHFDTTDVHLVDPQTVPTVDLATASFPCTDLSLAGTREGLRGKQSSAFYGFMSVIEGMGERRPGLVLLENVPGFLTSHKGRDFREAMLALNALGYAVDPFILDARWFVPQSRPRLFVVASLGCKESTGFAITSRIRPPLITEFIAANSDIQWTFAELPSPPSQSESSLRDIIEKLPDSAPEWWSRDRADYLYNQMSEKHEGIANSWMAKKAWTYGTVFRRVRMQPDGMKRSMGELRCDGIAGCLRTPKGGSGRQILFRAGYGKYAARLLTPRECARLMGADSFRITVPLNQALFGFGDAVCVPAISWIAEHYLNPVLRDSTIRSVLGATVGAAS